MLDGFVPFPRELATRYRQKDYWEDRSMGQVFMECFAGYADRIAVVAGEERISYHLLAERVDRLALHLLRAGIRALDRFVVQLPNVPEFVYLYFALQRVGAIPIMALPPHRYQEISQFVKVSEAVGYAFPDGQGDFDFLELAERVRREAPSLRHFVAAGDHVPSGCLSIRELVATESGVSRDALDRITIDPTLPAVFQLSGGTTGVPKLIPRTHNDYVLNSRASAAVIDIRPGDALLVVLPIAHNFPLASPGIQGFFLHGARIVLSTSTRPGDVFPLISRERITHLELVPALLIRYLADPLLRGHDFSSVRVINTGGQKLQPEVKRRAETLIPSAKMQEVFGMAEGLLCYVRLDDPDEVRHETVGRPVCADDEIKLVDDEGREVSDGEIGELWCRGPYTLRGYFRAAEHNARAFSSDGFYKSGDLMRRHPSGNLVVEGRKKDLINRGGEKISAEEVENLILTHPAVHNVACVPMPDAVLGERMCAFVIPKASQAVTLEELARFLSGAGLARFKLPERVELVSEFPLSPFGKVSKQALTKLIAEKLRSPQ
jgi:2,3-dihydroxybenzoate-AMP ligase